MQSRSILTAALAIALVVLVSESYAHRVGGGNYGNCMKSCRGAFRPCKIKCKNAPPPIPPTPRPPPPPPPPPQRPPIQVPPRPAVPQPQPPVLGRKCRWSPYDRPRLGQCSASCGGGTQRVTLIRYRLYGMAETGDPECLGSDRVVRTQSCNNWPCPPPPTPPV
ncbi:unnamed protein product [Owenia fusiformis]|uniref:Uncharacterized protein n=1 Tax=Owenia fusiformis TaxID=6347 RepID=A0A8S4NKD5_OWEFU|nr:unnamed protein product [Owenia fusiformis]